MADIKISAIAQRTGFSPRYWQKRIGRNEVPSAKFVQIGARRIFFVDEQVFTDWWDKQKVSVCQKISLKETRLGGSVLPTRENSIKALWEQTNSQSLKAALKEYSKS